MAETSLISQNVTRSYEIRAHLGHRLREYYIIMQQTPLPTRLTELIEQLSRRTEEPNCKPE
jgi:hypothetical protein